MRERVDKLLWERMKVGSRGLWVGTFHAISRAPPAPVRRGGRPAQGLRHLRRRRSEAAARRACSTDLKVPERMFPVRQVLSAIDRAKNQGIDARRRSTPDDYFDDVVGKAYRLYEERLAAANAVDFGGLLLSALQLCARRHARPRRRSPSASTTCWSTSSRTPTACSTGWCACCRGAPAASPSSATRTSRSTAGAAPTSATSSTSSATTRARAWSSWSRTTARPATSCAPPTPSSRSNTERRPKRLFTEAGDGEPHRRVRGRDRARRGGVRRRAHRGRRCRATLAPRDFAVFYRTNAQSRVLEEALRARDLPYVGRRRHALLRPRRDQGPPRLPARRRQPRRRHGAAADHQRPGARHRRRPPSTGSATSSTSGRSRPGQALELVVDRRASFWAPGRARRWRPSSS